MMRRDAVRVLLKTIESERQRHIRQLRPGRGRPPQGKVNIYIGRDAVFRIFDLHAGLTVLMQRTIRAWFESFLV